MFSDHLKVEHKINALSVSQFDSLTRQYEMPLDELATSECPICSEWGEKLRIRRPDLPVDGDIFVGVNHFSRHLGQHMRQLALSVLPEKIAGLGSLSDAETYDANDFDDFDDDNDYFDPVRPAKGYNDVLS